MWRGSCIYQSTCTEVFRDTDQTAWRVTGKGTSLGIQFDTLFTDDLYFKISEHAIRMAAKLNQLFAEKGYRFNLDSPTNQQFIILENEKLQELSGKVDFSIWEKQDAEHTVVRFATSWSTQEADIEYLSTLL